GEAHRRQLHQVRQRQRRDGERGRRADRDPHLRACRPRAPREEVHEDHLARSGGAVMQKRATRIKKGDVVFVLTGKEKGKTGKVLDIDHEKERAVVEKLMVVKRHFKRGRNPAAPEGGIVEKNGSIHLSNLALLDPESKKPTRIGTKLLDNGKRVRFAKRSGAQIDQG